MTTIRRGLATALAAGCVGTAVLLTSLPGAGAAPDNGPTHRPARTDTVAAVRRATARYHDPAVAIADGFVATDECAAHPELGGMGLHYVNPARIADPAIIATQPEVLLYEPTADGGVRLVGVEYLAFDPDQDLATDDGRPSVLGRDFDGPMPGHEPGMPIHFDLHAWIWKHNPAGQFAVWNPTVRCEP